MNPFVLARVEMTSPRPAEQVLGSLEKLVRDGFEASGRRFRLFGGRRGRYFSMSLGLPLVGGAAPVLRAWLQESAGPTRFDVSVGARLELVVFASFWLLLTVLGGGYQILLQLRAVAAHQATVGAVLEVLPGIAILAGLLALGFWLFRRRALHDMRLLLIAFRQALEADPAAAPSTAAPIY